MLDFPSAVSLSNSCDQPVNPLQIASSFVCVPFGGGQKSKPPTKVNDFAIASTTRRLPAESQILCSLLMVPGLLIIFEGICWTCLNCPKDREIKQASAKHKQL